MPGATGSSLALQSGAAGEQADTRVPEFSLRNHRYGPAPTRNPPPEGLSL